MSTESDINFALHYLGQLVHDIAKLKGWWDEPRNDGELIALIHSEASEALEGLSHGNPPSEHVPSMSSAEEEMADIVIRVADMCEARRWDLGSAVIAKIAFNRTRERRHGGKAF